MTSHLHYDYVAQFRNYMGIELNNTFLVNQKILQIYFCIMLKSLHGLSMLLNILKFVHNMQLKMYEKLAKANDVCKQHLILPF